jgi:hypothetical protein
VITRRPPEPRQDARPSPLCRSGRRHAPARPGGAVDRRQRSLAASSSSNAIASLAALEPGPLVTRAGRGLRMAHANDRLTLFGRLLWSSESSTWASQRPRPRQPGGVAGHYLQVASPLPRVAAAIDTTDRDDWTVSSNEMLSSCTPPARNRGGLDGGPPRPSRLKMQRWPPSAMEAAVQPETKYARLGRDRIAYQVLGRAHPTWC